MGAVGSTALCLSFLTLIWTTGCAPREIAINLKGGGEAANAVACAVFDPIYLHESEIAALTRKTREKIAAHNAVFEKLCKA